MSGDSFTEMLERYGEAHPPSMRYDGDGDFSAWQRRFRETVLTLRGMVPDRVAGEPEVVEEVDVGDHTRIRMRLPVSEASRPTVHLLVPKGIEGGEKRAGIVVYHGHERDVDAICGVVAANSGADNVEDAPPVPGQRPVSREDRRAEQDDFERRSYARVAVREGYIVLALPLWGWVGRDGHGDLIRRRDPCNVIGMAAGMYGMNPLALHLQDGEPALDYLASRPDVDAERLGCIGNSTGGRNTMWLAALDERVKACVPSGCMNTFRERSLKLSSCGIQYFPGLLQYGDVTELFSLIAPRAMQLQAGEGDALITATDRDGIETDVRAAYERLGAGGRFGYVLHPHGHLLEWEAARAFLESEL